MALFTGKGDDGMTKTFGCDQRISKSSAIAEALGALDEANSYLGIVKVLAEKCDVAVDGHMLADVIHAAQGNLFIIQAELAGAEKTILEEKLREAEEIVRAVEKELPPIKSFFISGGTELAALLDSARTLARRAERRVVAVHEEGVASVGLVSRAYLNRLSSVLYALARLVNHRSGITEQPPGYR